MRFVGGAAHDCAATPDSADRQLHLLQLAGDCAVSCCCLTTMRCAASFRAGCATFACPDHPTVKRVIVVPLALVIVFVSGVRADQPAQPARQLAQSAAAAGTALQPGERLVSHQRLRLFAVMTTTRPEIIVEGSNDGQNWLPYEFPYKAGDVNRMPRFVAPYQPRLDWQMWFAALGDYSGNRWFVSFVHRLLQGSPDVLALLADTIRSRTRRRPTSARSFTSIISPTVAQHSATGAWWTRELVGSICRRSRWRASARRHDFSWTCFCRGECSLRLPASPLVCGFSALST